MTYVEKVIAAIERVVQENQPNGEWPNQGEPLDYNPTVMDGHPNTLLIEDPETGTLYSITVEEA